MITPAEIAGDFFLREITNFDDFLDVINKIIELLQIVSFSATVLEILLRVIRHFFTH